jgi:hypothetical protein
MYALGVSDITSSALSPPFSENFLYMAKWRARIAMALAKRGAQVASRRSHAIQCSYSSPNTGWDMSEVIEEDISGEAASTFSCLMMH